MARHIGRYAAMKRFLTLLLAFSMLGGLAPAQTQTHAQTHDQTLAPQRVRVTGEIVDTWCTISGLMFARGTAHHQCAIWCALGGIPVSIRDADGKLYMILRLAEDEVNASNPRIAKIMTHEVTVDGELIERDGVRYLFVTQIADDKGVITMTHDEHGIQPFGN
ncbi:MAG: hypothetical protein ACRCWO_09475 [Bosea sp. (in: a-proteobacteria)]